MKTIKRRLLSLVLAMAMVLTLAPGALAANELTVSVNVSCTISATKDGTTKSGTDTLQLTAADSTPQDKPVTAITLNKTTLSLEKGKSETLSVASWTPTDATNKTVTWNSSDSSAVSVDQNRKQSYYFSRNYYCYS